MKHLSWLIVAFMLWTTPAGAGIFWEETFESGQLLTGQPYDQSGVTGGDTTQWLGNGSGTLGLGPNGSGENAVIIVGNAHEGTHSFASTYRSDCGSGADPNNSCGNAYERYFPNYAPELWVRFWHRWDSYGASLVGEKLFIQYGAQIGASVILTYIKSENARLELVTQTQTLRPCPNGGSDTECQLRHNVGPDLLINDGSYHCVEVRFVVDTTPLAGNGIAQGWVDGTQVINYTNVYLAEIAGGFARIKHYTQFGFGTRYTDQLAVGDTRIGCGATPPPPAAPSNLRFTQQLLQLLGMTWAWLVPAWALA